MYVGYADLVIENVSPNASSDEELINFWKDCYKIDPDTPLLLDGGAEFKFYARLSADTGMVGYSSLKERDDGKYMIAALVHPEFRKRKIGEILVSHAIDFARKNVGIKEIDAHVEAGSISEKICQRLGFFLIGTENGNVPAIKHRLYGLSTTY
ncbi:MAG: GNAT family N-acetyltransferase [Candidatus Aenigmarchaeota archaeon]|nr:GNAT family N-acetyltransferase [Candidatus Aenigmarchaeota archaeon]